MEYGNKARQRVATRTCNSNADALRRPVLYCSVAALYAQLCVVFPSSARIVEFTRQQLRWARQWAPTGTGTLVPILHASHHITHHTSTRICIYFVGHKRQEVNWNSKSHFPSFSRPTLAWPQAQRRWQRTLVVAVAVAVAAAAVAAASVAVAAGTGAFGGGGSGRGGGHGGGRGGSVGVVGGGGGGGGGAGTVGRPDVDCLPHEFRARGCPSEGCGFRHRDLRTANRSLCPDWTARWTFQPTCPRGAGCLFTHPGRKVQDWYDCALYLEKGPSACNADKCWLRHSPEVAAAVQRGTAMVCSD